MRKTGRCILSAVIAVLLMIGAIDYAFVIGKAKPVGDLKTSQSEVIVKDFIHDNYEISERNPWTDYGLHPIEYTESAGKSGFDQAISAKAAILVNVNSKEIYYEKNSGRTKKLARCFFVHFLAKKTEKCRFQGRFFAFLSSFFPISCKKRIAMCLAIGYNNRDKIHGWSVSCMNLRVLPQPSGRRSKRTSARTIDGGACSFFNNMRFALFSA